MYLMRINLILALFNMVPGFPLDGGRVLRALVWKLSGSLRRATQIASISGQLVAFGFIGLGVFSVISGQLWNGLWMIFIGWFLQNAASSAYRQMNLQEALRGVTVSQAMTHDYVHVHALTPLSQLVNEHVLMRGEHNFFITDNTGKRGMLTLRDITGIPRASWRYTTAGQVMKPIETLEHLHPDTALLTALQTMEKTNMQELPVVSDNQMVGTLSRERVFQYLKLRSQLGATGK
jgi:hypothetical protein